jgi:glycosyltransferase involved in cell wall biosynthesis
MARVVFFCRDSIENINLMEYYHQDVKALKAIGHEVIICNRYRDIPWNFDIVFVWWWTYALLPVLFARFMGRPSIVTGTYNFKFENKESGNDYFSRPWYERMLISLATRIANINLFASEREYKEVSSYFKLKNSYYFPHSIGEEYFTLAMHKSCRTGLLNIAWSGSKNLKRKGVWDILDAICLLRERGIYVPLTLVGKRGDGFELLQKKISELELNDYVNIIGEVSLQEKLQLLSQSKIYLQPSYFEGFGLATAEAMAAGCCVITCDVGEVKNVVGDCGIYVSPGNPSELADAVQLLLNDSLLISQINYQAQKRLKMHFSFSSKVEMLENILKEIT